MQSQCHVFWTPKCYWDGREGEENPFLKYHWCFTFQRSKHTYFFDMQKIIIIIVMLVKPLLQLYPEKDKNFGKLFSLFLFLIDFFFLYDFSCIPFHYYIICHLKWSSLSLLLLVSFYRATKIPNENLFTWNFDISV